MEQGPDVRPDHWSTIADLSQAYGGGSQPQGVVQRVWIKAVINHSRPSRSLTQERTRCAKWHACRVYEATVLPHVVSKSAGPRYFGLSNDLGDPQIRAPAAMELQEAANVWLHDQHAPIRPRRARSVVANVDVTNREGIAA